MSSPKQQEPRVISTTELDSKDARWVTLNAISWEDQAGTRVSRSVLLASNAETSVARSFQSRVDDLILLTAL